MDIDSSILRADLGFKPFTSELLYWYIEKVNNFMWFGKLFSFSNSKTYKKFYQT